jgi:hypothetical protein
MPHPEAHHVHDKPEALGGDVEWTSAKARTDGNFLRPCGATLRKP